MKKFSLISLTLLLTAQLFSQSFDISNLRVGGGFSYASEINNLGITLNANYSITDEWEAGFSFTHLFEKNYVKWNVIDFDAHYNFYKLDEKLSFYGLAGLSLTLWKVETPEMSMYGITVPGTTASGSDIGLNIGAGANYKITDNLNLAPELRFTVIDGSYIRFGVTAQYSF